MSLEKRNKAFTSSLAKNLVQANHRTYHAQYQRLVLTRRATEFFVSAFLVFGGQQFLIENAFFSPIWPAGGVALSALFLRGPFVLLGVFTGSFAGHCLYFSLTASFLNSMLFVVYIALIQKCAYHWVGSIIPIAHLKIFGKLIIVFISFSIIHTALILWINTSFSWTGWYFALIGEVNGILFLTPFCLMFDPFLWKHFFYQKNAWWWIKGLIIVGSHFLYFVIPAGLPSTIISVSFIFILLGYAYLYGQIPTCLILLGISVIYLAGTLTPFHLFHLTATPFETGILFALLMLNAIVSLSVATYCKQQYYAKLINP